ncbi:TPA: hypothetical protein ACW72O_002914 [Elizabethkingia anophelis]|uniref:hypothetical protein n=1 Tax=Elizabethkingia anophelis TaxID=1117645 RepID=UPI0009C1C3E9|nr:hypothetical protein [Elizabethkingia anophelis]AQW94921.1 hypothetical protein BBD30_12430 [Elizabethkingia anophelis]MCL1689638.1 hypothetical protein [Elizabethkingia anophelis]OPB55379.1 hypothetical protein BAS07_10370 [Elizabethkingia anophelis]
MKKLTRDSLKVITGAGPFQPSEDTGCTYVCCWSNNPGQCSTPVTVPAGTTVSCVEGAELKLLDKK